MFQVVIQIFLAFFLRNYITLFIFAYLTTGAEPRACFLK